MESDSCDELTESIRLPQMKLWKIEIELNRMLNVEAMVREFNSLMC